MGICAALYLVTAWLCAPLVTSVLTSAPLLRVDDTVTRGLVRVGSPAVLETMTWLTRLHGTAGILALCALIAAWLTWRKRQEVLPLLLASVPGGLLLNFGAKLAVERARPESIYALERLSSYSFPSGHTAGATVLYGFLLAVLWPHCASAITRAALAAATVALIALVAGSRIMLGMHYPSDCAAAIAEGVLWLVVCLGSARLVRTPGP